MKYSFKDAMFQIQKERLLHQVRHQRWQRRPIHESGSFRDHLPDEECEFLPRNGSNGGELLRDKSSQNEVVPEIHLSTPVCYADE